MWDYHLCSLLLAYPLRPDAINARADDVSGAELDYHERENAKLLFKTVDRKKVETPHNYYPNTDEQKIVRIPGATHLCITFDERCNLVTPPPKSPPETLHTSHCSLIARGEEEDRCTYISRL
jgi:hypothetical protein